MFLPRFLFFAIPITVIGVFRRINARNYWAILKKLAVWFLYLVLVLSRLTSLLKSVSPHWLQIQVYFWYSTISIGRFTNCATCCVSIFIGLPLNSCWPQHLHTCGRNISSLSTRSNPFLVFPGCPGCPPGFRFGVWLSDGWASGFFSAFLRRSADGGFDDIVLSKSLLTFSSCIFFSSSTTLDFNCSIAFACSIIISTSCGCWQLA